MPDISIIVPVYNVELYLAECVESLINQTYKDIEIILIDDGSTDTSGQICDEYGKKDDRIKVYHIKNSGPSVARNYGLEKSLGSYVMFVDSDDWIKQDTLKKCYELIKVNDSDIVVFNLCNFDEEGISEIHLFNSELRNFQKSEIDYLENIILTYSAENEGDISAIAGPCCKLMKKRKLDKCFFPKELTIGEDTCFILQVLENVKKVTYIDDVLYCRRMLSTSLSHSSNIKGIDERKKLVNWIADFYNGKKNASTMNQCLFHHYQVIIGYLSNMDNMKLKEKRKIIKRFLEEIKFSYDFKQIEIDNKNKNVRLIKKLLRGEHETIVLILYKLAKIKRNKGRKR